MPFVMLLTASLSGADAPSLLEKPGRACRREAFAPEQFFRWPSKQQPPILTRSHQSISRQAGERARNGWAPRGDKVRQHVVGDMQGQERALGTYVAPSVCEMPQQHVHAHLYPRLLNDRHIHREPPRALERACRESAYQLRVMGEAARNSAVENRQPSRLKHPPVAGISQGRLRLRQLPGAQKIAFPEQFCTDTATDLNVSDQESVEHKESDAVRRDVDFGPTPGARRKPSHSRDALVGCRVPVGRGNRLAQVCVLAQDVTDR